MRIAAITKFKHGVLFELLRELGWTQREFAKRCGINATAMGRILNLSTRPSERYLSKMEIAFGNAGRFVDVAATFPDSYIGFKRPLNVVQIQDVEPSRLEHFRQHQIQLLQDAQPPIPFDTVDTQEKLERITEILKRRNNQLTERERSVIHLHLVENKSLQSIGRDFGLTGEAIRRSLNIGLRKIRSLVLTNH